MLLLSLAPLFGCYDAGPKSGRVLDEAKVAGRDAASFPAADEDFFRDMDRGVALAADEVKGRNMWLVWTGGDDRFWDVMTRASFGAFDLLKTLSSHPSLHYGRDNRFAYLGAINEPCFEKATGPDPDRFGLWLDKRKPGCAPDPFENEQKYPGVKIGARGRNIPVGSYYGMASGVVGLRLFPNPDFDEAAAKKWDPKRYYDDPGYYLSKELVRPYRVGMSCGFCHVGPSPVHPPADPENPAWADLSSTVGAQYLWIDRIFVWNNDPANYMFQLVHTWRPGTLDTSLVSSDYINNPRTMNAVYSLGARLAIAQRWGQEKLSVANLHNKQFNDFVSSGPLTQFFAPPDTALTPRVLKDGSDSVGALGALNRVYLNIGLFSEEWLLHFNALVGGIPITPIEIAVAQKNSSYWNATEMQTPATALFLLKAGQPDKLKDAPGGEQYLTTDQAVLDRGKTVFAETCARCHSSKQPAPAEGLDPAGCAGPGYLQCWNRYWEWTKTEDYKAKMRAIVRAPDFLDGNFLSTEARVPVTLLQTNACSPLATNALAGNIWDNFSSDSYKQLPSVGMITVHDPFTGASRQYSMPAGGRGYTRPPSLISVWSTAPFLLNNTLGTFDPSPAVDARMRSFQSGIEQLLWPEKRAKDPVLGDKVPGTIDRTTARSWLSVPAGYLPEMALPLRSTLNRWLPWLFTAGGDIRIGPIPPGTPVSLLSNLMLLPESGDAAERVGHVAKVLDVLLKVRRALEVLPENASDDDARKVFADLAEPLLSLSKCPDFLVNRGHYFGTGYQQAEPPLSDDDKRALIEFIKTF
ncbi:hypothetical protein [Limobrevibacterium gyesilva]|uniref:Cytochrome c domain-containing protein n=1 Tax=Limobrevibacterium gyesilva TaxID=2991712 RepID=A0AA42CHT2_9PROT|nr:hypothetical protein [Limobrevibacterium gyesilva]